MSILASDSPLRAHYSEPKPKIRKKRTTARLTEAEATMLAAIRRIGEKEAIDRIFLTGKYDWIHELAVDAGYRFLNTHFGRK